MSTKIGLLPAALLLMSAGCASNPSGVSPAGAAVAKQAKLEETALASILQQIKDKGAEYRVSGADLLEITVYREEELHRIVRVSQAGFVSLPLVGAVTVGGLTLAEAEKLVSAKLKDYLINPQVTIFIKEYGNKKVYVLGEVKKPGSYDLPPESRLTVVQAISIAGGFTQIAARNRTKIIRVQPDGKVENLTIEVAAITARGEKQRDLPLEPNDVVYVPQSFF